MKRTFLVATLLMGTQLAYGEWWRHRVSGNWTTGVGGDADATTGDSVNYISYDILGVGTIGTLTMKNGDTATVAKNQFSGQNSEVTISELVVKGKTDTEPGTASLIVDVDQKLTLNGLNGKLESIKVNGTLTLGSGAMGVDNFAFASGGSVEGTYNLGMSYAGLGLTLTLTDTDVIDATLASGKHYEKSLFKTVWNIEKAPTITLIAGDYGTSEVIYKCNGTYYDGWTAGDYIDNFKGHSIIESLNAASSYIVVSLNSQGKGVEDVSALITAIPEPTTATLSLLALAALAARRRRK